MPKIAAESFLAWLTMKKSKAQMLLLNVRAAHRRIDRALRALTAVSIIIGNHGGFEISVSFRAALRREHFFAGYGPAHLRIMPVSRECADR